MDPKNRAAHGQALSMLVEFLSEKLSEEDATTALNGIQELERIHGLVREDALCLIRRIGEQRDRARQEAEGLLGILEAIFRTAQESDIEVLKPYSRTLQHFLEEQQAPQSTDEEIRGAVRREIAHRGERIRQQHISCVPVN